MTRVEATGKDVGSIIQHGDLRLSELRQRNVRRYISCLLDGLLLGAPAPYMAKEDAA